MKTRHQPNTSVSIRVCIPARLAQGLACALAFVIFVPNPAARAGASPEPARLTVVARTIAQDQGGWVVDYRLRYHGAAGMVVTPTEVTAKVEGWVSNSRVAAHAVPRWSSSVISGASDLTGTADVVTAADDSQRCRERAVLRLWADDAPGPGPGTGPGLSPTILSVAPGGTVRVRLRLEHQHVLYGDYDPLLGGRAFELRLGTASLRDALPLDREQYLAQPHYAWPAPPDDRRDTRYFVTGPDSLHLEAHVPGNQYYHFPERPVRYGTRMKLSFWYLIARGTEGQCRAQVAQYKDTPSAWKVLSEGGHEECLATVGRWVKVERVFRTEPDATTLALDFRITGAEVGEMWIDDVNLDPVGGARPISP